MKKLKFPLVITESGVTAKIRKATQTKNGEDYTLFIVDYCLLGKRKREARASFEEARDVALNACRQIANGNQASLTLTNDARLTYLRAVEALAAIGVKLDVAALEYVAAIQNLPDGATLKDAVEFYRRRHAAAIDRRTVKAAVDEMLAAKESAKLSEAYQHDLDTRLNRFADDFQMNIGDVSGAMIQGWIDKMKGSGRSKRNYLRAIAALFRFSIRRKWLMVTRFRRLVKCPAFQESP